MLFLFSFGITKGKWGTLLTALLDFKRDYDANTPLEQAHAGARRRRTRALRRLGLHDLADEMFAQLKEAKQTQWLCRRRFRT